MQYNSERYNKKLNFPKIFSAFRLNELNRTVDGNVC